MRASRVGSALLLLVLGGCFAILEGPAEDKALAILMDARPSVEKPGAVPARAPEPAAAAAAPAPAGPVECTLEAAMALALERNRDFLTRKEDLLLQALTLSAARYSWDPQVTTTLRYLLSDTKRDGARGESSGTLSGGVTQKLPWGGSVSVQGSSTATQHHAAKASRSASTSVDLAWEQPLLRGFGPGPAMESLVQARRNLLYELRRFELYRQGFAVQTLSRFFNLVRLRDVLENTRRSFEAFEQQYRQAKALFAVDRIPEIDVFRAEREMELARNSLEEARDSLEAELDETKLFLGLEPATELAVRQPAWLEAARRDRTLPEGGPERVPFPLPECARAALSNRLDLKNLRDALEDARRAVSNAGNDMLPDLDLGLAVGLDHDPVQDYDEAAFEAQASASVRLGLPWDFRSERDAFFRARVAEERARRAVALMEEQIRQEVRDRHRSANRVRVTIHLQRKILDSAEKRLRIAEYRFREGEIGNRDVVEAQQALLEAENRYIQAVTDRWIRDLELARSMGILKVGPRGMPEVLDWPESDPAAAPAKKESAGPAEKEGE